MNPEDYRKMSIENKKFRITKQIIQDKNNLKTTEYIINQLYYRFRTTIDYLFFNLICSTA